MTIQETKRIILKTPDLQPAIVGARITQRRGTPMIEVFMRGDPRRDLATVIN